MTIPSKTTLLGHLALVIDKKDLKKVNGINWKESQASDKEPKNIDPSKREPTDPHLAQEVIRASKRYRIHKTVDHQRSTKKQILKSVDN